MTFDLLIKNGTLMLPWGQQAVGDVGIKNGLIADIGDLGGASAPAVIDAQHLHVLPGVIDSQVHFRDPGFPEKETLDSGMRGAVLGGVTAIMEMPNTKPPTTTVAALQAKLDTASQNPWCHYGFFGGASLDNADVLPALEDLSGCVGIKIFMGSSTGTLLVSDDDHLRSVLRQTHRRVAIHAEDEERLIARKPLAQTILDHPLWRDEEVCLKATRRIIALARETRKRLHLLHITTAEEMEVLATSRDVATVEILPQHLIFTAPDCYEQHGSLVQMNPAIKAPHHRAALIRAMQRGLVDVVASDHAPHTRAEKSLPYPGSPSGMPGVQTLLPLMLDLAHQGLFPLSRVVDVLCAGPARVYDFPRKGRLGVGFDADITLVDLKRRVTIADIVSPCGWTPYAGKTVTGWPTHTLVAGQIVMQEGHLTGIQSGKPLVR
jgi:dihydroorotase